MKPVPEPNSTPFAAAPHELKPAEPRPALPPLRRVGQQSRARAIDFAKRAYEESNRALDKFATGKDDEAAALLAMARDDVCSALVAMNAIICEHGVKDGDWCEQCRKDVETARNYENQIDSGAAERERFDDYTHGYGPKK